MSTKITIETCYNKVSVEVEEDDLDFEGILNLVVVPALKGVGYLDATIDKYIETF